MTVHTGFFGFLYILLERVGRHGDDRNTCKLRMTSRILRCRTGIDFCSFDGNRRALYLINGKERVNRREKVEE